uniref:NADH-ubiquinone oxidoreductase chain 2 n=1 Tax=Onthophagus damaki TaxID=1848548 RepID=A0A1X9HD94_9SCAR|nr:NADH deshydrogenase subunit 2 [Onthophagus damaki]
MITIIIFCAIISGIMGMNQTNIRKILAFSSINHLSWMISSMLFFETIWMFYFFTYMIITFNIIIILKKLNIFHLNQLFSSLNNFPMIKFLFTLNFMSLGGLPPFLGFMPKWLTIQMMIKMNMFFISFMIILMTLITLFFYMRIMTLSMIMSTNIKLPNMEIYQYTKNFNYIYMINVITLMSLLFITILFNLN